MKPIAALFITLTLLIAGDALFAWTAPGAVPPSSNVAAPVHTGAASQIKSGGLGVGALDVAGGAIVRGTPLGTDLDLEVRGRVGASEYCDLNGVCFSAATVGSPSGTISCVNRSGASSASCLAGEVATGGGCMSSCAGVSTGNCTDHSIISSRPTTNGWACTTSNNPVTYVRCCTIN